VWKSFKLSFLFGQQKSLEAAMFDVMVLLAKELLAGLALLVEP
jgi:hypothetical protein